MCTQRPNVILNQCTYKEQAKTNRPSSPQQAMMLPLKNHEVFTRLLTMYP